MNFIIRLIITRINKANLLLLLVICASGLVICAPNPLQKHIDNINAGFFNIFKDMHEVSMAKIKAKNNSSEAERYRDEAEDALVDLKSDFKLLYMGLDGLKKALGSKSKVGNLPELLDAIKSCLNDAEADIFQFSEEIFKEVESIKERKSLTPLERSWSKSLSALSLKKISLKLRAVPKHG